MQRYLVIYHNHCNDGMAAAAVCRHALPSDADVTYHPASYGDTIPTVELPNTAVLIVDFSWPLAALQELADQENVDGVHVIDHHKTAQEGLTGLPVPRTLNFTAGKVEAIFDQSKSGATLTWGYFNGGTLPPALKLIEDRDIHWPHKLPGTRGLFNYLDVLHERTVEAWSDLLLWNDRRVDIAATLGDGLEKAKVTWISRLNGCTGHVKGVPCWIINSAMFASDIAEFFRSRAPMIVVWNYDGKSARVSLRRGNDPSLDTTHVSKQYPGGGGHAAASGFSTTIEEVHSWK